jgi:hypothetical protein
MDEKAGRKEAVMDSDQIYLCSKCKSEDVKKVSLVYELEVKATKASTLAGGLAVNKEGIAGLGGGIASSTGTIQSLLVQRITPPDKAKYKYPSPWRDVTTVCFILSVSCILLVKLELSVGQSIVANRLMIASGIVFIVGIFCLIKSHKETLVNEEKANSEYQKAFHNWSHSWFCNRCGNVFIIEDKT